MIGIDLFAGAGGMSLGATQAGIDVTFSVEQDVHAVNTNRKNHSKCNMFVGGIRSLSSYKIKRIPKGKKGTVVFGGPPCQGFSYSNSLTRHIGNNNCRNVFRMPSCCQPSCRWFPPTPVAHTPVMVMAMIAIRSLGKETGMEHPLTELGNSQLTNATLNPMCQWPLPLLIGILTV